MTYGTPIYDPRNDRLIVMAGRSGASSGGYRDHWTLYVDGQSGEITKTFKLNPYYWFQSLPILPDKYDVEFDIDDIELELGSDPIEYDLQECVNDPDNIRRNVTVTLVDEPAAQTENEEPAVVTLNGDKLTITPNAVGQTSFTLSGSSNGRTVSKTVNVNISDAVDGVCHLPVSLGSLTLRGSRLYIGGHTGTAFTVCTVSGIELVNFVADTDNYVFDFGSHTGIFVIKGNDGSVAKLCIK